MPLNPEAQFVPETAPLDADRVPYPARLKDRFEIARHVHGLSDGDVDLEVIEEHFWGCVAELKLVDVASLKEGDPDGNVRNVAKERRYTKRPVRTMPPIVVADGKVEDGNHRLRVVRAKGLRQVWAYVVSGT